MAVLARAIPLLWHSYLGLALAGAFASIWPLPSGILALAVVCLDKRLRDLPRLTAAILVFAVAFFYTGWRIHQAYAEMSDEPAWLNSAKRICGQITEVHGMPGQTLRIILSGIRPEEDSGFSQLPGYARWSLRNPPQDFNPLPGQSVCLTRPVYPFRHLANRELSPDPAIFLHHQYWRIYSKGEAGSPLLDGKPSFWADLRDKLKRKYLNILGLPEKTGNSQARAIIPALLFGDRFYLTEDTVKDFISGSLAHSLALSGQHLCIAGLAALLLTQLAGRMHGRLYLKKPRLYCIAVSSVPLALAYLWLGNAPPSLLRAIAMLLILTFWTLRKNAWHGMDLVCAAVFLLCCFSPLSIFETGMQFSIICVLVIALVAPLIPRLPGWPNKPLPFGAHKILPGLWQIFWISLGIQIFLLPVTLAYFSQTSLLFPLNLVWLPSLAFIVLPFSFAALIFSPFLPELAKFFMDGAVFPCSWLLEIFNFLRDYNALEQRAFLLPHWSGICAFALLLAALLARFTFKNPKYSRAISAAALILLACGPLLRLTEYLHRENEISILDVGQGQSILFTFSGSGRLLIDAGGSYGSPNFGKRFLAPALAANSPPILEAAINSHPDMDHLGGFLSLLPYFKCDYIFHNGHKADNKNADLWHILKNTHKEQTLFAGDVIYLGRKDSDLRLEVLHPPASPFPGPDGGRSPHPEYEGNNASLVLRLCKGDTGLALFPGDAEKQVLQTLAKSGKNLRAKILIAPHHGSDRCLAPEFYRKVSPEIVIASCGYRNRWGFPGKNLKRYLKERDKPLFTTGNSGRIDITFDQDANPALKFSRKESTMPESL